MDARGMAGNQSAQKHGSVVQAWGRAREYFMRAESTKYLHACTAICSQDRSRKQGNALADALFAERIRQALPPALRAPQ